MQKREILLVLTDRWCDWEAAYVCAVANAFSDYTVKTIALDAQPKVSMGGIRAGVDYTFGGYGNYGDLAIAILPGGLSWEENEYGEIAQFVRGLAARGIPVAAICGATYFLCRHGFLNGIRHTGDSPELFLDVPGYTGAEHYVKAQVVADGGFITANETAAVEFAYEIFKLLNLDSPGEMAQWFDNFQNGAVR